MIGILQGALVAAFFIASNVVAAGVVLVLGMILQRTSPWLAQLPWPWLVIGAAGAISAYLFLKGAGICAAERARLQYRAGRRGGIGESHGRT